MKPRKKMERRVRAWAVVCVDGVLCCSDYPQAICRTKEVAKINKTDGTFVVPCTITYEFPLPSKKARGK